MVEIDVTYEGSLRCRARHGPSGAELPTDAPADNQGRGASFSPTDLVATALGTCILTTMGIVARREGWSLDGSRARVVKEMGAHPRRHVRRLSVEIQVPAELDPRARESLEEVARTCPVAASLAQGLEVDLSFAWGPAAAPGAAPLRRGPDSH
jgi:putative redox protein